jgi:hypothetical protein
MDYDGMHNAMTDQANKQSGLLRRFGLTGAIIVAACLGAGATFLGYGVDANLPWPVTANTTIAAKYCGGTVLAGTGSTGQFTLTLPAVTGFPSDCSVLIKNGDSTNGKILSGFPSDLYAMLWPKQSVGVKIVNGTWQTFYNPGPWTPTANVAQFYASPTGSDSNDCLTPGTACTFRGACSIRSTPATFFATSAQIALADGTYSAVDANNNLCTINGNSGGSSSQLTSIQGNSVTPTNVILAIPSGANGIVIEDGGEAGVNNLEITAVNGSGPGIQCRQLAVCDYSNVYWGTWGNSGSHLSITAGASSNMTGGGETILANFIVHWNLTDGAHFTAGGTTHIPSALTWSQFASAGNSNLDISGWSYSGSGAASSSGPTFSGTGAGYLSTPGAAACNGGTWPGSGNCQLLQGYQDSHGDPLNTPWSVANGGTGNATAAAHSIPVSEGTAAQNALGPCTTSQVIVGQGLSTDPACGGVPAAALPSPSASTLGGIESIGALAHNWIVSIDTSGVPHQSQPASSDLSDVTAPTTWTATDGSGAGLTFATNADTRYVKSGKFCIISFMIQWPTTSDTHIAQINGIPATCAAYSGSFNWVAGGTVSLEVATISTELGRAAMQPGGTSLFLFGNGNQMTNANMSNGIVRGTITYITN